MRSAPGRSSRSAPSACRTSKSTAVSGTDARRSSTRRRLPKRDAVTWNGCGRPSGRRAIASPSSTRARHGERERGLDDLGHARGDVVERAGEDGDVVAVAVDLDPRAVELPLDRRRVDLRERRGDVRGGLGEHRLQRPADRQAQGREPRLAVGQRDRRDRAEVAAEHQRPPDRGEPHVRRLRDGVGHHARERALAQVADSSRTGTRCSALARAARMSSPSSAAALGDASRGRRTRRSARTRRRPRRPSGPRARGRRGARRAAPPSRRRSAAGAARPTGTRRPRVPPRAPCGAAPRRGGRPSRGARTSRRRHGRFRRGRPGAQPNRPGSVTSRHAERMFGILSRSSAVRARPAGAFPRSNSTDPAPSLVSAPALRLHVQPKLGIIPSATIGYPPGGS